MSTSIETRARNIALRHGGLSALRHVGRCAAFAPDPTGWGPACARWLAAYDGQDALCPTVWRLVSGMWAGPKWVCEGDAVGLATAMDLAREWSQRGGLYAVLVAKRPGRPVVLYLDGAAYYCEAGLAESADPRTPEAAAIEAAFDAFAREEAAKG